MKRCDVDVVRPTAANLGLTRVLNCLVGAPVRTRCVCTRSALVEAITQLNRALAQIATLPDTPALRRDQIKFQVALANALIHTKGYAAPEKASFDQARLFIEGAEALGEPPEDPLVLFSVLYGFWVANLLISA
jgi:hypothetical protein